MAITKDQMIEALTKASVELKGDETVAQLKALLEEHELTIDEADKTKTVATVKDQHGNLVREYARDVHGDDFEALANEKAAQNKDWTVAVL